MKRAAAQAPATSASPPPSGPKTIQISAAVANREALLKAAADERYYLNRNLELAQTVANQAAEIADLRSKLAEAEQAPEVPTTKENSNG